MNMRDYIPIMMPDRSDVAKFPSPRGVAAKLTGCSRQRRLPVYLRVADMGALNTPRPSGTPLREGNFLQSFSFISTTGDNT